MRVTCLHRGMCLCVCVCVCCLHVSYSTIITADWAIGYAGPYCFIWRGYTALKVESAITVIPKTFLLDCWNWDVYCCCWQVIADVPYFYWQLTANMDFLIDKCLQRCSIFTGKLLQIIGFVIGDWLQIQALLATDFKYKLCYWQLNADIGFVTGNWLKI